MPKRVVPSNSADIISSSLALLTDDDKIRYDRRDKGIRPAAKELFGEFLLDVAQGGDPRQLSETTKDRIFSGSLSVAKMTEQSRFIGNRVVNGSFSHQVNYVATGTDKSTINLGSVDPAVKMPHVILNAFSYWLEDRKHCLDVATTNRETQVRNSGMLARMKLALATTPISQEHLEEGRPVIPASEEVKGLVKECRIEATFKALDAAISSLKLKDLEKRLKALKPPPAEDRLAALEARFAELKKDNGRDGGTGGSDDRGGGGAAQPSPSIRVREDPIAIALRSGRGKGSGK